MTGTVDFATEIEHLFSTGTGTEADPILTDLLAGHGFVYPERSVVNLRLLEPIFPAKMLGEIARASLTTPLPDLALNGMERICSVAAHADIVAVCRNLERLAQLLNICGSSSFLTVVLCRNPAYFKELFIHNSIDIRRTEEESLAALRTLVSEDTSYAEIFPILRRFKYREMLRIAARDLNGLAPLEEVTAELSGLAAATLQIAYEVARRHLIAEHGIPLMVTSSGMQEADLVIIGMGKLGGRELNFSSDIDLIYFYSSDKGETSGVKTGEGEPKGKISLHVFFVKLAEMITKAISQITEDGFVFRTDLGLRPEGKSGDLAVSLRSAEIYYESWGQTWERSAMLKARPVAGSIELGENLLNTLGPFIYRKYLDYTLIEDMMAMKKKIDASLVREREREDNIKLGRGGIREIEFFIQALQLVYAGKNPTLRERNSLLSLLSLAGANIIKAADCLALSEAYCFLRIVEHRIQVVQERQTHNLPSKEEEMQALARRCGFLRPNGLDRFREVLDGHRKKVSAIYGDLFLSQDKKLQEEISPEIYIFLDPRADSDLIKDMLAERRFENVDTAYENLLLLRDGPTHAHLTERGRRLLEKIAPLFLQEIFFTPDPDMALANLEKFLRAVGPRSSFYALLAENRELLRLLVSLFGMSEFLSQIFILHPELLDNMVSAATLSLSSDRIISGEELLAQLQQAEYFEDRLDELRRFRHEGFLCIGMDDIRGNLSQTDIAGRLTKLAETCLNAAHNLAKFELSRFGRPTCIDASGTEREADFAILGMGKLGGGELNYHSDLDIIYVYDYQGTTDGEKKISNHEYFAKLGQKIISILSTPTREGYVYKIDTRLRPSGNAGPLVTSLESFTNYHRTEAHPWERQALTKARVMLGGEALKADIEAIISDTVYGRSADEEVRNEIHRLRMRMEHELAREKEGSYNIKTGRGGMVDVEFIVQYLQLKHGMDFPETRSINTLEALQALRDCACITDEDFTTLQEGYTFLRHLENRLRIIHDYSMNDLGGSQSYLNKLALRLGYEEKRRNPGEVLMKDYERITEAVRGVFERILGT
jgi:[glutamine synthetase] adenylyltransferase / [glutamine synthetase]-adenylyl-L-tyrosine phosphorylase